MEFTINVQSTKIRPVAETLEVVRKTLDQRMTAVQLSSLDLGREFKVEADKFTTIRISKQSS